MDKNKGVSPVIGVILMLAITLMFAAVIGDLILSSSPPPDEEDLTRNIEKLDVKFEQNCNDSIVRVTLEEYSINHAEEDKYVNIIKDNEVLTKINNEGSSVLVDVSDRGFIQVVPSIKLNKSEEISSYEKSKKFEYYCN